MRLSIIGLVWRRESRDLLRDRRTLFLLLGLPVILFPVFSVVGFLFALATLEQITTIGVTNPASLSWNRPVREVIGSEPLLWSSVLPPEGSAVLAAISKARQRLEMPPLVDGDKFNEGLFSSPLERRVMPIVPVDGDPKELLKTKRVDAILVVPADARQQLESGGKPRFEILSRDGDEISKIAVKRLDNVLAQYIRAVRTVRFVRKGLPEDFDTVIAVIGPKDDQQPLQRSSEELRDALIRFFPFMLVMWSMAGALHPAIDLGAGEKERGTIETLLISPAERTEIVLGKFLAITGVSGFTALWNLACLTLVSFLGSHYLKVDLLHFSSMIWCFILVWPLAALFSALCLGLGVYARSSKEGQYYLVPLFLLVMPLVMFSLLPTAELTVTTSLIPVTGVCLLLQKLMLGNEPGAIWYLIPVAISLIVCVALSLRWAVSQFHREDVLFREAERIDLWARIRSLFSTPA